MKIGILADIHGNIDALNAVLAQAKSIGIQKYCILGDLVGYYYGTKEVIETLQLLDCHYCRGNHEEIYERFLDVDAASQKLFTEKYGSSYCIASQHLSDVQNNFLLNLPHPVLLNIEGLNFILSHGAPWDVDARIYPDANEEILSRFDDYDANIIFVAHSHYPVQWVRGHKMIINAGSVGQPRQTLDVVLPQGHARANWGEFDTVSQTYTPMTTIYDARHLFNQIDQTDPTIPYLKNILMGIKGKTI